MVVTPDEIRSNFTLTESAIDTYKFLLAHAGVELDEETEADFIIKRNARIDRIMELNAFKLWCEKAAASLKECLKHAFNIGTDESLPANVKWSKQSFTYGWNEGAARFVAEKMIESNLCTADQLFDQVTVTGLCKACGITTEKLLDMFDGAVDVKPKERTLSIK